MYTFTAAFTFPDGATASASVTMEAPERRAEVNYAGEFSRLPDRFEKTFHSVLRAWATQVAEQIGATVEFTEEGKFEWWAE